MTINKNKQIELVIEIKGGMLQTIYTPNQKIKWDITLVDWDNIELGDDPPDEYIENIMIPENAIW